MQPLWNGWENKMQNKVDDRERAELPDPASDTHDVITWSCLIETLHVILRYTLLATVNNFILKSSIHAIGTVIFTNGSGMI